MGADSIQLPVARANVPAVLEAFGILATAQRVEIAAIMLSAKQHMSADQVLLRLHDVDTAVSKATVYNTLGLFAEKGLLRQVIVDPTRVFYDSNTLNHHHFYNVDDGTLTDIEALEIAIEDLPKVPSGTVPDGVDVILRVRNKSA